MTDKMKDQMKEIMKELLKAQIGSFSPGQNGWSEYVNSCISTETCPKCGNDLFVDIKFIDKGLGRISSECSTCDWKNYDYIETPETGLLLGVS